MSGDFLLPVVNWLSRLRHIHMLPAAVVRGLYMCNTKTSWYSIFWMWTWVCCLAWPGKTINSLTPGIKTFQKSKVSHHSNTGRHSEVKQTEKVSLSTLKLEDVHTWAWFVEDDPSLKSSLKKCDMQNYNLQDTDNENKHHSKVGDILKLE